MFNIRFLKYILLFTLLIANASWWGYLDRPHTVKPTSESLDCVSYSAYRDEYTLNENKTFVTPETIDADLAIIAERFRCVRIYTTLHGMDRVPEIAQKY